MKIWFVLAVTLVCLSPTSAVAMQQDADKLIAESDFPWFDAETKQIQGGPVPVSSSSGVGDRRSVPLYVPPKTTPKPNNPAPAGGAVSGNVTQFVNAIVYIVGGILLAALVAALVWAFYRREELFGVAAGDIAKSKKRTMKEHIRHLPFEVEEQEGDFRTAAESALASQDYSKAVIYLYAELLVILDENNLVRLQRGRTNRQYLNAIRDHQLLASYFQSVMTTFEDAFFGKHEISKERAEVCFAGKAAFEGEAQRIKTAKFQARSSSSQPSLAEAGS